MENPTNQEEVEDEEDDVRSSTRIDGLNLMMSLTNDPILGEILCINDKLLNLLKSVIFFGNASFNP